MNTTISNLANEDYLSVNKDGQLAFDTTLFINNLLTFIMTMVMAYLAKKFNDDTDHK